ncbi:hypothetical protein PWR66_00290 [Paraburkholderia sp. A1RO-5]|uniref:hypothetical protein n=1 Tax=Paraburkholderia sp. A1RO-5 TaxID=3028369 RepID=UPI003B7B1AF0
MSGGTATTTPGTAAPDNEAAAQRPGAASLPRHFGPGPHRPRRPASAPDAATLAPQPLRATGGIDE